MSDWAFGGPTAPFYDSEGREPARFVFEQVTDGSFSLVEGIRYDDGDVTVDVPGETTVTDLASIPLFMAWFVPANGRHTPAAVVHDKLVRDSRTNSTDRASRDAASAARATADDLFLTAMAATAVPTEVNSLWSFFCSSTSFRRRRNKRIGLECARCWAFCLLFDQSCTSSAVSR